MSVDEIQLLFYPEIRKAEINTVFITSIQLPLQPTTAQYCLNTAYAFANEMVKA